MNGTGPDRRFRRCASWLLAFTLILPAATVGVLAGEGPALTLGSTNEYRLLPMTRVRNPEALAVRAEWGLGTPHAFGQLLAEGEADDIGGAHFAVEHETIANGQYVMGRSSSTHGADDEDSGLTTAGKFHLKYGYTEIRYEVDLDFSSLWQNMAMVYGLPWRKTYRGTQRRFGLRRESYRDLSTLALLELDLVEYVPSKRRDIFHQYINDGGRAVPSPHARDARPTRSVKSYSYCGNEGRLKFWLDDCTGTVTVTKGMEWTPRGYRSFYRVHGLHDELKVLKKSEIQVQRKLVTSAPGEPVTFSSSYVTVTGSDRDPYFELTDADDPDTVLEKVAISHMPSPFKWWIWSYNAPDNVHTFFRLDYIRVFQPRNRYADMDPVYQ